MANTKFNRFEKRVRKKREFEQLETKSLLTTLGIDTGADVQLNEVDDGETAANGAGLVARADSAPTLKVEPSVNHITGDVDGDGTVGFKDFLELAANFGAENSTQQHGDVDGDGQVGFKDFLVLAANFGAIADADTTSEKGSQEEELVQHPVDEILIERPDGPTILQVDPEVIPVESHNWLIHGEWEDGFWCPPCGMG